MPIGLNGKDIEINNTSQIKTLWAIFIGINQYDDFQDLNYCANDAVGLANALETIATQKLPVKGAIFDDVNIIVHAHTSNKYSREDILPTKQNNILTSLGMLSQAQPQDTILFYFSGHGHYDKNIDDTILCLKETNQNNIAGTGLLITTVLAKITNSLAKQQLIWLDACHSGGIASPLLDAISRVTNNNPSLNLYCITACDRNSKSFETHYLQHGIFTKLLIEALAKGIPSTPVKPDALYEYIVTKIEQDIINVNNLHEGLYKEKDKYPQFKPQCIRVGNGEFVIGVYPNLAKDNRVRGALALDGFCPSSKIVEIGQFLATKGGFGYQPYPNKSESLSDSISALLTSDSTKTALLYLKGKFETNDNKDWFVFADGERISVDWLAKQLSDSPVEQQIIILDCYPTVDIENYIKPLKESQKAQCIVAISLVNNWLSDRLIQIIFDNQQHGLTATNFISQLQTVFSQSNICNSQQRAFYRSDRGILNLILDEKQHLEEISIDRNFCPYKGLAAFTFRDRSFFFGRDNLRDEIIRQLEKRFFLLVVGASGSGKSSLIQAGVVPKWLKNGFADSESTRQVWIMRPGKHPIKELAIALSQQDLLFELQEFCKVADKNRFSSDLLEGILHLGVESFVTWLRQQPHQVGLLVIDQFEELFTNTPDIERKLFLQLILGAVKAMNGRLKVISTLRSDFITSCLEIPELEDIVGQNEIKIPSYLTKAEYRKIIIKPAARVGLAIEPQLVNVLIEEVITEKGALPLLQLTLDKLWQEREKGKLSLEVYQKKTGGIKQVLQEKADSIYQELTESEQECAQWIFTQLVSLGEGKEDTRQRRTFRELITPKYSKDLINSTLDKLRDSRLIVMSDRNSDRDDDSMVNVPLINGDLVGSRGLSSSQENIEPTEPVTLDANSEVTIEIAHEILIRNWQQLRWWLDTNRENIRLRARIEERAKQPDDLLRGSILAQAKELYINYGDELTNPCRQFIENSIEEENLQIQAKERQIKEREEKDKLIKRGQRQIIMGLTGGIIAISMVVGVAFWQLRRANFFEINALSNSSQKLLKLNQKLLALPDSLVLMEK